MIKQQFIILLLVGTLLIGAHMTGLSQFTVGGSASALGSNCYRLTNALNSQAGYVWQNTPLNLNQPFDYKYSVYLGTNNGGADGIVFVLRGALGAPYIGTGGGGLGFNNLTGVNVGGTIGVEVDTWQNGNQGDPVADHIGIISQANTSHTGATSLAAPVQASATSANVEDGNFHTLNISWDPATQIFEVYLDCDFRLQYQGDIITNIFSGDSLVHWGFVGTTGGANNDQRFCFTTPIDSLVTALNDTSICVGEQVILDAGNSAIDYSWTPSTGLSNVSSNSPTASPAVTTTYMVEQTYECDTLSDTVTVNVVQPNFSLSDSVIQPLCNGDCNGGIDLSVLGTSNYAYAWNNGDLTEDITNLCVGIYEVTVTDTADTSSTYLCYVEEAIVVAEPAVLMPSVIGPSATSCPDGLTCDAQATGQAVGGTLPYSFAWLNGETSSTADSLCSGLNQVIVTDANGCFDTASVTIGIPDSIETTAFGDALICVSNQVSITATSIGGTPPFSYTWFQDSINGVIESGLTSPLVSPDSTKRYWVLSTDVNGCIGDTSEVLIKVRPPLGLELPELDTICPYDDILIAVAGTGGDSLYTYAWSNGDFGASINVSPDFPTTYFVTVGDGCGSTVYSDKVFVQVGGYGDIQAEIDYTQDTICQGERVVLTAQGRGGFNGPAEYRFNWSHVSNQNSIQEVSPSLTKTYVVTISDLCISKPGTDTVVIHVGSPEYPELRSNPKTACATNNARLALRSFDPTSIYNWQLGNELVNNHQYDTLQRVFNATGCYDVSIEVLTQFGCKTYTEIPCALEVLQKPFADFDAEAEPSNTEPWVSFENRSINAESFIWEVQGSLFFTDSMFSYEFLPSDVDIPVRLTAFHNNGCTDTITRIFRYNQNPVWYIPNSFTPDGDGLNDVFKIVGENIDLSFFELAIFDRWGKQVFFTKNPDFGWNGQVLSNGPKAPNGVYGYMMKYINAQNEELVESGQLVISRGGSRKVELD